MRELPFPIDIVWVLLLVVGICQARSSHASSILDEDSFKAAEQLIGKQDKCLPAEAIPQDRLNLLTDEQRQYLGHICWRQDLLTTQGQKPVPVKATRRGIPAGVKCKSTHWCDSDNNCSEVCERGTVELTPWLRNALRTQWAISRQLPFCYATLPGTHNSGITLADGYGNLDPQFQSYFQWIRWVADDAHLRTNDHILSLTDQLNLGVRNVELDTHEVSGKLRIAHCGGYHGELNVLVNAINVVATLLGHPIHWDTETIGCNPSLSSIPVTEQRTFKSALKEVSAWLDKNEGEFVILYLDDQPDLLAWGELPKLLAEIQSVFPLDSLFTPLELQTQYNGTWPSIDTLSQSGKKVLFVTGNDYGPVIDSFMFSKEGRHTVCGWREPDFQFFTPTPQCLADGNEFTGQMLSGTFFRQLTCELFYGPMNCNFVWRSNNDPLLDESSLPEVYKCGENSPSPDSLTPRRAASTIWSWAPGHPFPDEYLASSGHPVAAFKSLLHLFWGLVASNDDACALISNEDGRWRVSACNIALPLACRRDNGTWTLGQGSCPAESAFAVPRTAKENIKLSDLLKKQGTSAFLPLQGPEWNIAASSLVPQQVQAL